MNLLINIKNLHSKTNMIICIGIIKQTVKNCKIINLFMNKILLHIYMYLYLVYILIYMYEYFINFTYMCNYIQTHCNDRRNTFRIACRQWYSYNNPGIIT